MKRLLVVVGASMAVGYVLGARAGRERYEHIVSVATRVKDDPRVQDATQKVTEAVKEQAPVVKDKLGMGGTSVSDADPLVGSEELFTEGLVADPGVDFPTQQDDSNPVI